MVVVIIRILCFILILFLQRNAVVSGEGKSSIGGKQVFFAGESRCGNRRERGGGMEVVVVELAGGGEKV